MRVISGLCGGRRLETPSDYAVRPTTDRVKEALFSSLQFELAGAAVLDLFSGTGQLGIEALSRGAASAVFVDNGKASLELTKRNLAHCSLQGEVVEADSVEYLSRCSKQFDIAFLDPPYSVGLLQNALPAVSRVMRENGVIVAESPYRETLAEDIGNGFCLKKVKKYGSMQLAYYRKG